MLVLININIYVYANDLFVEGSTHSPGQIKLTIFNGTSPYQIYKSEDKETFDYIMETSTNQYIEYGLTNGKTYYYKVIDSNDNSIIVKQTIPFTTLEVYPLSVLELGDYYVQLEWTSFYSDVDIYVNDTIYIKNCKDSSITVNNLQPNTEYLFYYINNGGEKSNTIRVTTTKQLDNIINRLDKMLNDLFVSDEFKTDSDNDGIVDGLEPIYNKGQEIVNSPVVKFADNIGGIISEYEVVDSIEDNDKALDDLPRLEVEFIPGKKINVFDLSEFTNEIKMIRFLLVCMLYVELFFYFVQCVIPRLGA